MDFPLYLWWQFLIGNEIFVQSILFCCCLNECLFFAIWLLFTLSVWCFLMIFQLRKCVGCWKFCLKFSCMNKGVINIHSTHWLLLLRILIWSSCQNGDPEEERAFLHIDDYGCWSHQNIQRSMFRNFRWILDWQSLVYFVYKNVGLNFLFCCVDFHIVLVILPM